MMILGQLGTDFSSMFADVPAQCKTKIKPELMHSLSKQVCVVYLACFLEDGGALQWR